MTEWETIHDGSSHISQVRLVAPKNYSVERGNGIFDAVSKSSIPTNNMSKHKNIKKTKSSMFKSIWVKFILIFLITTSTTSLYWQCSKPENNSNNICIRVHQLQQTPAKWIVDTKSLIHQSLYDYSQVTQPLISKIHNWTDKANVMEQLGNLFKPLFDITDRLMHTKDLMVQAYLTKISPFWDSTKKTINMYLTQWRQQLDDYIDNGKGQGQEEGDYYSNMDERRGEDSMVEEKIKKTAKRILDYIDQLNQESVKSGMKQEEAKEKAQEIIKSITEEINVIPKQEQVLGDRDIDIVAFEIQSIIKIAIFEKTQLKEQLELVQTRLSDIVDKEDTDLLPLINALKLEIDHLRASAENNVRKRTKQALDRLNQDVTMVTTRMKEDVLQAQRVALKDLRQVYRDIYHTNQVIDNLNIT